MRGARNHVGTRPPGTRGADRVRSGYLKSTTPGVPSRIVTVTLRTSAESTLEMALSANVPQGHS
jgi:hypothetical protein